MTNKPKVLIICFKNFEKNLRGIKQINLLKNDFEVHYSGFEPADELSNLTFYKIDAKFRKFNFFKKAISYLLLLLRLYKIAFEYIYSTDDVKKVLENNRFDLIISHDLKPLHILFNNITFVNKPKILLDAHEFFKGLSGSSVIKKFNLSSYKYIKYVHHIDTVCESIADFYKKEFNQINVSYTLNTPIYKNIYPTEVYENKIRIIHHGYADKNRELELMIETMKYLDPRYELDLMLVSVSNNDVLYINSLETMAKGMSNVNFINPVKPNQIIEKINSYDIGLYILPDKITNMKFALPNKIFDFIQARLMIVVGPSVEMSKIVKKYNVGLVSENFNPKLIADMLNKITIQEIKTYKQNAHIAAKELNAEKEMEKLKDVINGILREE